MSTSLLGGATGTNVGQVNVANTVVGDQNNYYGPNAELFDRLNPIRDASYKRDRTRFPPNSTCIPGTRKKTIQMITDWADTRILFSSRHIMWLYGHVGCGKSAIAQVIAENFDDKKRLIASHFFFRDQGDRSGTSRFAATIASQLAASIPEAKPYIEHALRAYSGLLDMYSLEKQLQHLVFEPTMAVLDRPFALPFATKPYLIVVDGLDECESREGVKDIIYAMLVFFEKNPRVPLRLFISSRVEEHIQNHLDKDQVHFFNLVDHTSLQDIHLAMRSSFLSAQKACRWLRAYGVWPNEADLKALVQYTGGSFIFMSTLLRFILDEPVDNAESTPEERLRLALTINPGLDGLFTTQLSRSHAFTGFSNVISTIALIFDSLSIRELSSLLDIATRPIIRILTELHAIIQVPGDDHSPVTLFHSSLHDYLNTEGRSNHFFARPSFHRHLAFRCMLLSTLSESEPAFQYAAGYWKRHWECALNTITGHDPGFRSTIQHFKEIFPSSAKLVSITYPLYDSLAVRNFTRAGRFASFSIPDLLEPLASRKEVEMMVAALDMVALRGIDVGQELREGGLQCNLEEDPTTKTPEGRRNGDAIFTHLSILRGLALPTIHQASVGSRRRVLLTPTMVLEDHPIPISHPAFYFWPQILVAALQCMQGPTLDQSSPLLSPLLGPSLVLGESSAGRDIEADPTPADLDSSASWDSDAASQAAQILLSRIAEMDKQALARFSESVDTAVQLVEAENDIRLDLEQWEWVELGWLDHFFVNVAGRSLESLSILDVLAGYAKMTLCVQERCSHPELTKCPLANYACGPSLPQDLPEA